MSIIRDRFRGDAMARVMSLIFAVFILIPVMAPGMGQAILWIAPWRWIFWTLALLAAMVLLWMLARLPETLRPENRIAISARNVLRGVGGIITHRSVIGYMLASGVAMSGLIGFILSVQQIMFDTFDAQAIFPVAFAVMAGSMGLGSLINSRLVSRFGARRLSQGALIAFILICALHVGVIKAGWESLPVFLVLQSLTMLSIAFTASNFSAISMEPFSKGAGIASSFQSFLTTAISATLGSLIGLAYDGTVLPLALGMACFGCAALAIVFWAERGQLFTRPGHHALRQIEI